MWALQDLIIEEWYIWTPDTDDEFMRRITFGVDDEKRCLELFISFREPYKTIHIQDCTYFVADDEDLLLQHNGEGMYRINHVNDMCNLIAIVHAR